MGGLATSGFRYENRTTQYTFIQLGCRPVYISIINTYMYIKTRSEGSIRIIYIVRVRFGCFVARGGVGAPEHISCVRVNTCHRLCRTTTTATTTSRQPALFYSILFRSAHARAAHTGWCETAACEPCFGYHHHHQRCRQIPKIRRVVARARIAYPLATSRHAAPQRIPTGDLLSQVMGACSCVRARPRPVAFTDFVSPVVISFACVLRIARLFICLLFLTRTCPGH